MSHTLSLVTTVYVIKTLYIRGPCKVAKYIPNEVTSNVFLLLEVNWFEAQNDKTLKWPRLNVPPLCDCLVCTDQGFWYVVTVALVCVCVRDCSVFTWEVSDGQGGVPVFLAVQEIIHGVKAWSVFRITGWSCNANMRRESLPMRRQGYVFNSVCLTFCLLATLLKKF